MRRMSLLLLILGACFPFVLKDGALQLSGRRFLPIGNHEFVADDDPYSVLSFTVRDGKAVQVRSAREGQVIEAARRRSMRDSNVPRAKNRKGQPSPPSDGRSRHTRA
jgi:hypothetical protein